MKREETESNIKITREEIRKEIGQKIKEVRRSSRGSLPVRAVAEKLGISRVTLTQIENGKRNINAVLLWQIACRLGCNIQDLFPPIPKGFQITAQDTEEVKKKGGEEAVKWAEILFGKPTHGS